MGCNSGESCRFARGATTKRDTPCRRGQGAIGSWFAAVYRGFSGGVAAAAGFDDAALYGEVF